MFQWKRTTHIPNGPISTLKKMDDRFTTELYKVIFCHRDKVKIGLFLKNSHQQILSAHRILRGSDCPVATPSSMS